MHCHWPVSVGIGMTGSQSVSCIASSTSSGSDEEEDVILSLTEMVCLCCPDIVAT